MRRVLFFLGCAVLCAVLIPAALPEFRWVPEALSLTYVGLAVLSGLDTVSRHRHHR